MKPCPSFPSLDIDPAYALHDRDGFIEFATSMWLHTADVAGKPTRREVEITLRGFPRERVDRVLDLLARHRQLDHASAFAIVTQPGGKPIDIRGAA